jgi:hypothetical protein
MANPTDTTNLTRRIQRLVQEVSATIASGSSNSVRIGSYEALDRTHHEVILIHTSEGDWEVRDRAGEHVELIENLGTALDEAVAVALEYRRDCDQRAVRARAARLARAVLRRRAALTGDRLSAPLNPRQAA